MPAEFVVQHPSHANPPSLLLPLMQLAQRLAASDGAALPSVAAAAVGGAAVGSDGKALSEEERQHARAFLSRAWPRLTAWFGWFNRTQQGALPGSYRYLVDAADMHQTALDSLSCLSHAG